MNQQARFLIRFFAILVAAYLVIAWNPVNDHVIVPFTAFLARIVAVMLNATGERVVAVQDVVQSSSFALHVENGCNGIEAMIILLACIVAFPATWRARAGALLGGTLLIQALNEVRLVTLYYLGAHHRALFDVMHSTVWQAVIILAAFAFFIRWSSRIAAESPSGA